MASTESVSRDVVRRRRPRGPTYLVARGASWFFQIRVPDALTPTRRLPPLRVKLTVDSRRTAQRKAAVLAAYATDAFARWTSRGMGVADAERTGTTVWWDVEPFAEGNVGSFLQSLQALERRLSAPPRTDHLSLDALIGMKSLGEIVAINREAADENGHPLVRRNADLLRDQTIQRWRLATDGSVPDGLQLLMDRLAELRVGQADLLERFQKHEAPVVDRSLMRLLGGYGRVCPAT